VAASAPSPKSSPDETFHLSELLGDKVFLRDKKIGRLADMIIVDYDKYAEVTHIIVSRPFGNPMLVVPWEFVSSISKTQVTIEINDLRTYEGEPAENALLIGDHIMDKKVLDINDTEIEVVYDLTLVKRHGKLYATAVDSSRFGRMRRMGFRKTADNRASRNESANGDVIPWFYVQPLPPNITSFKGDVKLKILKENLSDVKPVDLADMLEDLDHEHRMMIFNQLDMAHASDTLEEIEPNVQRELVSSLEKDKVTLLIRQMTPGQAADLLAALPHSDMVTYLGELDKDTATKVRSIIEKQEEHVANYSTSLFVTVPPTMTAEQAQTEYHLIAKHKDVVMYLYVVDETNHLLGVIDIKELLAAVDSLHLKDFMIENVISLKPTSTLKDASDLFNRYDFRAIPVTDDDNRIIGVVTHRDVMRLTHHFIE
jgi:CBS domain-containing protein/sporulation protein YlmC with PRC-barrel domain